MSYISAYKKIQKTTVQVVGLGYIGLPTAALLSNRGYDVRGVDIDARRVAAISSNTLTIFEPDLESFLSSAIQSGRLQVSTSVSPADIHMICVPTPFFFEGEERFPDLSSIHAAVKALASVVKAGDMIILESTSPVGTTEKLYTWFKEEGVAVNDLFFAYCPERVLPSKIMMELLENDRVIGGLNQLSTEKVKAFYETFVKGQLLATTARTAELSKLIENSFRDVNIAFANEVSMLAEDLQVNASEVIALANHHPRVNILKPGVGVGGHCIAVDPWFIIQANKENASLMLAARHVNNKKTDWVIGQVLKARQNFVALNAKEPRVVALGLTFKPDVDDIRESPAALICLALHRENVDLCVVEPHISDHSTLEIVPWSLELEADIFVCLVQHKFFLSEFKLPEQDVICLDYCGLLPQIS